MNLIQIGGLLLLLVVLPLGSWYYLQTGLNYRIQALNELKDIAPLADFELVNYNDSLVKAERFADQLVVGHFYTGANKEAYFDLLQRMEEQFDERKDVYFLTFRAGTDIATRAESAQLLLDSKVEDPEQFFFLHGDAAQIAGLAKTMKLDGAVQSGSLVDNARLFFADSAMVRSTYDMNNAEDLKLLIKHITLNLHPIEEPDIIFERETEK
ncbi:hypothetical protein IX84_00120 [Phaeodactylibacter xiamenensis]|uniref:Uncharacterized protein n=2 Tax=Phaeodactylibacter xiamenensis TaxID=1524460 RepID=A0A098SC68_9BACT|nr:hypothetical protein IX84_00120 [Phaeodactylibacter xiamenensis]